MNMKIDKYLMCLIVLVGSVYFFPTNVRAAECNGSTVCGKSCDYGGQTYNTVLIGTQCWFKENLNIGTMITNLEVPDDTAPTPNDPSTTSKWCYDDSPSNCTSEGGLYTWAEVNALPNSCNSTTCNVPTPNQGICPTGWHIPSDAEQYTLENYLTTSGQTCDATRNGWDCSDAGVKLRLGGSSGFDALGAGNHETNGALSQFDKRQPSVHLWSSSNFIDGYAYNRAFDSSGSIDTISRRWSNMHQGFSARCLADVTITSPTSKGECKKEGWKSFVNPTFKNQGDCVSYTKSNESAVGNRRDNWTTL
jgi:uncharacterized protein (TIGR02145 family)